jgi:hypothetical protein
MALAFGTSLVAGKGRGYEDSFVAKGWLLVWSLNAARRLQLSTGQIINGHNEFLAYLSAGCDACTAHPPVVPDVVHVWLLRVEKYT